MEDNLGRETVEIFYDILEKIRRQHPLVHIDEAPGAVLRGNASEILAVAGQKGITSGVESVHGT